jgi:hypothetical protein
MNSESPEPLAGRLGAPALALILLDNLQLFSPTNVPQQFSQRYDTPIQSEQLDPPQYLLLARWRRWRGRSSRITVTLQGPGCREIG